MKNVDSLLKAELEKLGVPVERLKYGGKAACFIVYQLVVGRDTFFSDDEEGAQEFTYQVHVYSKTDYIDILQRLKTALKAAGFYAITIDAETYEQDTGYYHVPVEIKYAGEVEEGGTRRRFHYLFRHVRRDIGAEDHNGKQSARESGRENLFRRKPCFLRLFPRSHRQRAFRKARRDYLRRNGCRGGERR